MEAQYIVAIVSGGIFLILILTYIILRVAGHVIPNIALIEQLKNEFKIAYIGTDGIEEKMMKLLKKWSMILLCMMKNLTNS